MTRRIAVLRPEPGNARTAAAIETLGLEAIRLPLFAIAPLAWAVPDPHDFDTLVLTSANAVRQGGAGLARLRGLPVLAVGQATAAAARDAGFAVTATGAGGIAQLIAGRAPERRLHLAGRAHEPHGGVTTIPVYAADSLQIALDALPGCVALLHSVRAARAFAALPLDRSRIRIAALSEAVVAAAGTGWARAVAAASPDDTALVALAATLAD